MKQIFEWLRGAILNKSFEGYNGQILVDIHDVGELINEAEAKWEKEVCELLDKLITETPQCKHGVCEFRHEEECVWYDDCESCLVSAIKDLLVNPNSRFRKISEVE